MKNANETQVANAPVANATPIEIGTSTLSGFRYTKGLVHVELKNGVTGIVGETKDFPISVLFGLKGLGIELKYTRRPDKDGYKRYNLMWSL